jgi:hypothetical protein
LRKVEFFEKYIFLHIFQATFFIHTIQGVGISMVMISAYNCISYVMLMSWSTVFLYDSVTYWGLPWGKCDNDWNTENCSILITPTEEYWERRLLGLDHPESEGHHGNVQWHLLLAFLLMWTLTLACASKVCAYGFGRGTPPPPNPPPPPPDLKIWTQNIFWGNFNALPRAAPHASPQTKFVLIPTLK